MGCAASATGKLTSVMPIDSEETVKYETRKELAKVAFSVPEVPAKKVLFELSASCLKLVTTLVLFQCFTVLSGLLVKIGEREAIMFL